MPSLEGSSSYSRGILIIILQSSQPNGNFYNLLAAQIAFIVQLYKLNWSQVMTISSLLQEVHVWKCYIFNKRKTWSGLHFYNPTTNVVARNDYMPIMYFESAKTNSALLSWFASWENLITLGLSGSKAELLTVSAMMIDQLQARINVSYYPLRTKTCFEIERITEL